MYALARSSSILCLWCLLQTSTHRSLHLNGCIKSRLKKMLMYIFPAYDC
jgi:hypothetical protein